jgi:ABC-type transporter Mla subunit MlaD
MQDLTPQIRTRLNRVEKMVGWFVFLAVLLLLAGFVYYVYDQALRRGWFEVRAPFQTYSESGDGLAVGDPVKLMGFPVGRITRITAMPARHNASGHNVEIDFEVVGDNYTYIWTDSSARLTDSGFLGKREVDINKGIKGYTVYITYPVSEMSVESLPHAEHFEKLKLAHELYSGTNLVARAWWGIQTNMDTIHSLGLSKVWVIDATKPSRKVKSVWMDQEHGYVQLQGTNEFYQLTPEEPPSLQDRLQGVVNQIETALPNILKLTNQLSATLSNSEQLTSNLNAVAAGVRPVVDNLVVITSQLKDPHGSLGEWLIPTNVNQQLALALFNANTTLTNVNSTVTNVNGTVTNVNADIGAVLDNVGRSLDNLASITSNLNNQVQVNSNMLTQISDIVIHSDQFIQGLKHHWLLRSAFKEKKPKNPPKKDP